MSAAPAPTLDDPAISHSGRLRRWCLWFLQPKVLIRVVLYLATAIYLRTIFFDYVYDDAALILVNPWMASWKFVPTMFTHSFWAFLEIPRQIDFYRPLVMLSFAVIFRVLGAAPGWFHLTAAGLHILATYLVYRLACETTDDRLAAAIAAGIFGLHPTKVETVAWISGISDSLSFVFFLSSMIWYFKWRKNSVQAPKQLIISAGFLLLALFSKESAIFAPCLIAIYEFSANTGGIRERSRATLRAVLPFVTVTIIALGIRLIFLRDGGHMVNPIPPVPTLLTAPKAILWYLGKQLWPIDLSVQYPVMFVRKVSLAGFLLPLIVLCIVSTAVVVAVHRSTVGIFFLSWFALMMAPIILYLIGLQEHDRYFYFASVATSIGLGYLFGKLRPAPTVQSFIVVGLFLAMAIVTIKYESYWDNDVALFTRAMRIAPDNTNASSYLAFFYAERHQFDEAEAIAKSAIASPGQAAEGWYMLGEVRLAEDKDEEARVAMEKAVQLTNGHNLHREVALADVDLKLGKYDEAARLYRDELKRFPYVPSLHTNLATALKRMGKEDEAARELELGKRLQ